MRIVITGGHFSPAFSFAEVALDHQDELWLISAANRTSLEVKEFERLQVPHLPLYPIKYNRFRKILSLIRLPLLIIPLIQSYRYLRRIQPDSIVTFGSFNAIPVCLAARILRIPYVIHEQCRVLGLANRFLAPHAAKIAVSYPSDSARFEPVLTGNLLRKSFWKPPTETPFSVTGQKPVIYITGGNQGSAPILAAVVPLLSSLKQKYQVYIQYGRLTYRPHDDNEIIERRWFSANEVSWLMHHAYLVISRGGANTVAEIMAVGTPAIIIPLAGSANNEQMYNAQFISESGSGLILPQSRLTADSLLAAIHQLETDYDRFERQAKLLSRYQHADAAARFYQLISQVARHASNSS